MCFPGSNTVYPKCCPSYLKDDFKSLKTIVNELCFLKKAVIIQWKARKKKDFLLVASKLIEKVRDPLNAKEHYQSPVTKRNRKSVKQSEIITYQPKTFKNPNTVDIKSVITEHPKTSNNYQRLYERVKK